MTDPSTGWAIVGTGSIATTTIPDLLRTENVNVVAVVSRRQASADQFAATWSIPHAYEDLGLALANPRIDVVYICTPQSTHFEIAREAISAGKHVLCEKPFTLTRNDAEELFDLAREHDVFIMEAMWMRFNPNFTDAIAAVRAGVLGEARSVHASLGNVFPPGSRHWDAQAGGGALLEMGIYSIALTLSVFGPPDSIGAWGQIRPDGVDVSETVYLGYVDGRYASLNSAMDCILDEKACIGGTHGTLTFDQWFMAAAGHEISKDYGAAERVESVVEGNGYVPMFRAFSGGVLRGERECAENPRLLTIEALRIADDVRRQLVAQHTNAGESRRGA